MNLPNNTIIASGPVIIEDAKVLLNKEQKEGYVTPWMFPGGQVENLNETLEQACKREVAEEMNIDIKIIKPLRTLLVKRPDSEGYAILAHYLAERIGEIKLGEGVVEYGWHDINNLPDDCTPNVYEIIKDLK